MRNEPRLLRRHLQQGVRSNSPVKMKLEQGARAPTAALTAALTAVCGGGVAGESAYTVRARVAGAALGAEMAGDLQHALAHVQHSLAVQQAPPSI